MFKFENNIIIEVYILILGWCKIFYEIFVLGRIYLI